MVVPYLCANVVDEGDWFEYPQRAGISHGQEQDSDFWALRLPQLQYWLFFAPIKQFFGDTLSSCAAALVKHMSDGETVVDLCHLDSKLELLADGFTHQPADIQKSFRLAWDQKMTEWFERSSKLVPQNDDMGVICFSIAILIERIALTLDHIVGRDIWGHLVYQYPPPPPGPHSFPWNRMLESGWCPSHLRRLRNLRPAAVYYASLLNPPDLDTNHKNCTDAKCTIPGILNPKHVKPDCTCDLVAADQKLMCDILKDSSFPLIRMEEGGPGEPPALKVIRYKPFVRYIAISHVWSDGLGNPKNNSLPACQLLRLTRILDEAYMSRTSKTMHDEMGETFKQVIMQATSALTQDVAKMYFWCDTICCPTNDKSAHVLSLSIMPETYSKAEKVIVLDSYLQSYPPLVTDGKGSEDRISAQSEMLERVMRIKCSRWTQRLWTLQEGALARELWFQFADGLFDMDSLVANVPLHMLGDLRKMLRCMGTNEAHSGNIELEEYVDEASIVGLQNDIKATWGASELARYEEWNEAMEEAFERSENASFQAMHSDFSNEADQELTAAMQNLEMIERQIPGPHKNIQATFKAWGDRMAQAESDMLEFEKYFKLQYRVCQAISTRRASVISDEAICLSTLLKLDTLAVAETLPEDRMRKFWEIQPAYCNSLVEYTGPKLSVPGFQWAPSTLMDQPYNAPELFSIHRSYKSQSAELTSAGLVVSFPGLIAEIMLSDSVSINLNCFFWDLEANRIIVTNPINGGEKRLERPDTLTQPAHVALIFLRDTLPRGDTVNEAEDVSKAIVAFVQRLEDNILHVIRGQQVSFGIFNPGSPDWDQCYEVASQLADQPIENSYIALKCGLLQPHQKWCLLA